MMGSARTTLCLLAAAGAVSGGIVGAVVVERLSDGRSAPTAVVRDPPATAALTRAARVAAMAERSALRQPTPWSAAAAKAARAAGRRHPRHAAPGRQIRTTAPPVIRTQPPVAPPAVAPVDTVTTAAPVQTVAPPVAPPATPPATGEPEAPVTAPAPAPEAAPGVGESEPPGPERAPARPQPTPDPQPTGASDDSG